MIPILYFQCDYIFYVEAIWIWEEIQLAGLGGGGEIVRWDSIVAAIM